MAERAADAPAEILDALVEARLLTHEGADDIDMAELQSALADLRKAMSRPNDDVQGDAK